jgi:lipid-A-disaccharide synthase-like uncharacterized protein
VIMEISDFILSISNETLWLIIGFVGLALFMLRFIAQWVASKEAGRSVIPVSFWYFSLVGTLVLTIYAIYRQDPVFILAQTTAFYIYFRNLVFIGNKGKRQNRY